jgi:cyclohexanecarboxylate-CoA ligase
VTPTSERYLMGWPGRRQDQALSVAAIDEYYAQGRWRDRNMADDLREAAAAHPERLAFVGLDSAGDVTGSLSYAELDAAADHVVRALDDLGVKRRDRVLSGLANRVDVAPLFFGVARAGAVYVNLPHTYGVREYTYVITKSRPTVVVLDALMSPSDLVAVVRAAQECESVREILIGGATGVIDLPALSSWWAADRKAPVVEDRDRPLAGVVHIGFTSGTTGFPKGVMNSHQGFDFLCDRLVQHIGRDSFGEPPVNLVVSPVGHLTGLLWGVALTVRLGGTSILLPRWNARVAWQVIEQHAVTVMFGAPTFLNDLMEVPDFRKEQASSLAMLVVAGAPIPRPLMRRAQEVLGCALCPAWGMSEHAIGVAGRPQVAPERGLESDGLPLADCEVSIAGPGGDDPAGGLRLRSPGIFVGYFDEPGLTAAAVDDEGWLDSGDLASIAEDGWVTLQGRTKDIVIRGGLNIPVADIENLLIEHDRISEVAVVGLPDDRLGERAVAFVVTRGAASLTLGEVTRHLLAAGLSKHYLPEGVVAIEAMPKTPSGKIRKIELRDWPVAEALSESS